MLLLSVALSLGDELPLRQWANHLPLFELFRFPSLFRYFTILLGCLLASRSLNHYLLFPQRKLIFRICLGIGIIYMIALTYVLSIGFELPVKSLSGAFGVQALLGLVLLSIGGFLLARAKNGSSKILILGAFTFLDLLIFVQLNGPTSIYSPKEFVSMQSSIEDLPKGYPSPPLFDALRSNTDKSMQVGSLYRNTGILYKRFAWDGYTPYLYKGFLRLEQSDRYERVVAEGAIGLSKIVAIRPNADFHDSHPLHEAMTNRLKILDFDPNQISLRTTTEHPRLLTFNQNFHPGWKAFLDGERIPLLKSDINLLSLHVPKGEHIAQFAFRPGSLINALYISGAALLLILFYLVAFSPYRYHVIGVSFLYLIAAFLFRETAFPESLDGDGLYLVNSFDEVTTDDLIVDRFLDRGDQGRLAQHLNNAPAGSWVAHQPKSHHSELTRFLESRSVKVDSSRQNSWMIYHLYPPTASLCNFEGPSSKDWKLNLLNLAVDETGNHYQDCSEREYSATYHSEYGGDSLYSIEVNALVKGQTEAAQIVISTKGPDGKKNRAPYRLRNILPDHSVWTTMHIEKVLSQQGPIDIEVYLWNPRQERIVIDDFEIRLHKS